MAENIPVECTRFKNQIDTLNLQVKHLQAQLQQAPPTQKKFIREEIRATQVAVTKAQKDLAACVAANTEPPPPNATKPEISKDTSPVTQTKVIPFSFLQAKFDEFFNKRTAPPLFQLRFDHLQSQTSPPRSSAEVFQLQATGYQSIFISDLGQLDHGYYFNDINSSSINVNINTDQAAPLEVRITFETGGDPEMPSTALLLSNMDFTEFFITIKFRPAWDIQAGKLEFLDWVQNLQGKSDGEIESALPQFVNVHIRTTFSAIDFDFGGATQKRMRKRIFEKLKEKRDRINLLISTWILGGNGSYRITDFSNDGRALTVKYTVPSNVIDPFPAIPSDWPSASNPHSNPHLDFSPGVLANIDHIVVLTMENRSFDHMLGYLRLPPSAGGMGRMEVDGLDGSQVNPFEGKNHPSFALPPGDTIFAPEPGHGFVDVFNQISGGKMDGFVRSYVGETEIQLNLGPRIMGYHTGTNLPVYDALARDFAISHRWFAAHPGPTFCNRFYELTGRLNLTSGLDPSADSGFDPGKQGFWELNNSSPLTPVFTKTIFELYYGVLEGPPSVNLGLFRARILFPEIFCGTYV
jgi:hypothetical protein